MSCKTCIHFNECLKKNGCEDFKELTLKQMIEMNDCYDRKANIEALKADIETFNRYLQSFNEPIDGGKTR